MPGDRLTVGGGARAQSKLTYNDEDMDVKQPGYMVADLMAQYRLGAKTLVQLNVNNLFDKNYYSSISSDIGTGFRIGAPQEFRLSLKHEF